MKQKFKIILCILFVKVGYICPVHGQDKLFKIVQYDTLGNIQKIEYRKSLLDQPENVLVLYNINYRVDENSNNIWDGYEIATYYQSKRNIPSSNIIGIKAPTGPTISRLQYDSNYDPEGSTLGIRQQIKNILNTYTDENGNLLRGKIKYIVLTKGIPHRIEALNSTDYFAADYASVDASIAMIFNGHYDITWNVRNPYYWQDRNLEGASPFIPEYYTNHLDLRLCYLVTRLDGYSVENVFALIDRGVNANLSSRSNTFVLDDADKYYDNMQEAYYRLKDLGASVYPDPWEDSLDPILSITDSVIGIVSHGIHAGMSPDYIVSEYDFNFSDGAIFSSYESYNGVSFSPNINMQQGQISDFIQIGGSGGVGNVYEPWSSNIADEWILFPAYFAGYSFAEAAYMSLINMDFTAVVVGDPLMRIGPEIAPAEIPAFRIYDRNPKLYTTGKSQTTVAQIVFSEEIDTLKLPDFYYYPDFDSLETYTDKNYLYLWSKDPLPLDTLIIFQTNGKIYSTQGDSLEVENYAYFRTRSAEILSPNPVVYRATPVGIEADLDEDLVLFFSQKMNTETIFPLLGSVSIEQEHSWLDSCILHISLPNFLPATFYSFYLDEHAKSIDGLGLGQNFYFNFETASNYIAYDIDNDGQEEFAINSNKSLLDGYEHFADSLGHLSNLYDQTDINLDNQAEFFISRSTDNHPSYFWDPGAIPYTGYLDECFSLDDDEDGTIEYAFDDNGSGYFTKVYDPNGLDKIRDIHFVLYKFYPAHLSQNVNIMTSLQLEFSIPVKYDEIENYISIAPEVEIKSIQTELNGRKIKIHLAEPLAYQTEYAVSIEKGLSSINNDSLSHRYEYRFTTGEEQPAESPRVISFYPGDSLNIVDNTPTVRFVFSVPMDTTITMPVSMDTSSGISWTPLWTDNRTLYLIPLNELQEKKTYWFTISTNLRSKNGALVEGKVAYNFTSGEKSKDSNNPFILQVMPLSNSKIRESQKIRFIFSEWMEDNPENWLSVQIAKHEQPYTWSQIGANLYSISGNSAWRPQSILQIGISSNDATDKNGNHLLQDYNFQFTVIGLQISRDVDGDGIIEYVIDDNGILSDGLELYQDPGGIITETLFVGDIDNDTFYDFLIADSTGNILLTWYPARTDSGIIGFTEQLADSIYEMSTDLDDLVEKRILINSGSIQKAIPRIRNHQPQNLANMVPPFSPMVLDFNLKMKPFSVVQNVIISPQIFGNWTLNPSESEFTFIPQANWNTSTVYTVEINADFQGANGQFGSDSTQFSFRIADSLNQQAGISWQFPQNGDSVHSESIYYFGFSMRADTTSRPTFLLVQDFNTYIPEAYWISDTILCVKSPVKLQYGDAVLNSTGQIRFLSTESIEFNNTSIFIIQDDIEPRLIKQISGDQLEFGIEQDLSYIFNQPLDTVSFNHIQLYEISDSLQSVISYSFSQDKNYLSIKPQSLMYNTDYMLKIDKNLRGISQKTLEHGFEYFFKTETWFEVDERSLSWHQENNYLIVNWPLPPNSYTTFELYISEDYQSGPDTIKYTNLFNISQHPSWLIDLNTSGEKFYIFARLEKSGKSYWSNPALVYNLEVNYNELVSVPVLEEIPVDLIQLSQNNLSSITQWSAQEPGWKSAKYDKEQDTWLSFYLLEKYRGSLVKVDISGQFGWVQSIPDSVRIEEPSFQSPIFRSVCNPFFEVNAGELADILGQASRIAIWDNDNQGWNEAVYDTISSSWINDFLIDFLTPVYIYTPEEISFVQSSSSSDHGDSLSSQRNFYAHNLAFPSRTELIYFSQKVLRMAILKNNEKHHLIAGCGIDQKSNIGFVNIGNLDRSANWKFEYYGKNDQLLHVYDVLGENSTSAIVPESFSVGAPFPNPFNSTVTIPLNIPDVGKLKVTIYNILGQSVHIDEYTITHPIEFKYAWNSNVASGIYFAQINFGKHLVYRKLILIK